MKQRLHHPVLILILTAVLLLSGCGLLPTGTVSFGKSDKDSQYYVEIPADTVLISYEGDINALKNELAEAIANCEKKICVRDWLDFNMVDFYQLPYSSFWLKDFEGSKIWGRRKGEEKDVSYAFYDLTYYDLSKQQIEQMKQEIDAQADAIIRKASAGADLWSRIKTVHDELCRLISYDKTQVLDHCHDSYGALVMHTAVCSGYACAFSHVMSRMEGGYWPLSYSDTHAWNTVYANTYDCYVDTTWDDTDLTDRNGDPYIDYSMFFITREEVGAVDAHSIKSMDPISYMENPDAFNYYVHEGCLVQNYDLDVITEMMKRQYDSGSNVLTVRFENEADYRYALQEKEKGFLNIYDVMYGLEYYERFLFWSNDDFRTVTIGLYAGG